MHPQEGFLKAGGQQQGVVKISLVPALGIPLLGAHQLRALHLMLKNEMFCFFLGSVTCWHLHSHLNLTSFPFMALVFLSTLPSPQ